MVGRLLDAVHEITSCEAARRRTPTAVAESVVGEQVLDRHLGDLGHGKLALAAIRAADDVRQRHARAASGVGAQRRGELGCVQMGLHGRQGRRRVVLKAQVPQTRQLVAREGAKTRRVSWRGDRGVIRSGGERVVRERGRGRRSRVGRVRPRALGVPQGTIVVVVIVVLVGVRS